MSNKIDFLALVIGPPGHGKTSLAAHMAEERLRAGRWVLVQDAGREYEKIAKCYPDPGAFRRELAAASAADKEIPRGASFPCSADAVLELGAELGAAWNKGHATAPRPICIVINEASSSDESGPTWIGKLADRVINQRRHLGLELVFCLQRPSQLSAAFYDSATEVCLFRQKRADNVVDLEKRLGVPAGALARSTELPRHRYLRHVP